MALHSARNGRPGVQIVVQTDGAKTQFTLRGEGFVAEWYRMVAVPVEYNTGDGETQGGDAFIVYPGGDGPWLSMRLEAERHGTEDLELLRLLRERNPYLYDRLITQVFRSNSDYTDDEALFDDVYRQLLEALAD